jgi:hypothetical protein
VPCRAAATPRAGHDVGTTRQGGRPVSLSGRSTPGRSRRRTTRQGGRPVPLSGRSDAQGRSRRRHDPTRRTPVPCRAAATPGPVTTSARPDKAGQASGAEGWDTERPVRRWATAPGDGTGASDGAGAGAAAGASDGAWGRRCCRGLRRRRGRGRGRGRGRAPEPRPRTARGRRTQGPQRRAPLSGRVPRPGRTRRRPRRHPLSSYTAPEGAAGADVRASAVGAGPAASGTLDGTSACRTPAAASPAGPGAGVTGAVSPSVPAGRRSRPPSACSPRPRPRRDLRPRSSPGAPCAWPAACA